MRKHGIDRLSSQLSKVLVLTSVHLEESSLDLSHPLMIAKKLHPDLLSRREVRHLIKLRRSKAREKSITSLASGLVSVNLLLTDTDYKNNVSRILTNFPNPRAYALKMSRYTNLLVWVVHAIKVRQLAGTSHHVAIADHGPIKVE